MLVKVVLERTVVDGMTDVSGTPQGEISIRVREAVVCQFKIVTSLDYMK